MYVDIVTSKRSELEVIDAETGLLSDPPDALLACIAWEAENPDEVTVLQVWQTPDARGDFAFEKVMPLAQAGKVVSNPKRLKPLKVFIRGSSKQS